MGKYLLRINSCLFSDFFHLTPYIAAVHGLSAACHKDGAGLYFSFLRILLKKPAQLPGEEDSPDLEEGPTDIVPMDASVRSARSVSASDDYVNVLRYDVSISGRDYTLLLPPEYADSLYVDSQGRLFNISAGVIQGRLVDGNFNPYAQTGKLVYLTPCLGNNFYTIKEYGSPNYVREYYWSLGRLQYRDTYVNIQVNHYHHIFKVSDTLTYIVIVLMGGCLICLWRKSSR